MKLRIMRFEILLLIAITIFLVCPEVAQAHLISGSQVPNPENPPEVPVAFKDVHSLILNLLEKKKVPSITIAVAKDGKTLWEQGYGWAQPQAGHG